MEYYMSMYNWFKPGLIKFILITKLFESVKIKKIYNLIIIVIVLFIFNSYLYIPIICSDSALIHLNLIVSRDVRVHCMALCSVFRYRPNIRLLPCLHP